MWLVSLVFLDTKLTSTQVMVPSVFCNPWLPAFPQSGASSSASVLFFFWPGSTTYRILAPQPGIKSMPLRWKCKALTTKLPENSLSIGISNVFVFFYWKYGNVIILKISREAMEIWRYYLKPTFGHTLQSLLIHLPAQHGLLWGYQSPWRDMRSFQIHTLLIYSLNTLTLQCILSPGKKKRRHEDRWRKKGKKRKRTEE